MKEEIFWNRRDAIERFVTDGSLRYRLVIANTSLTQVVMFAESALRIGSAGRDRRRATGAVRVERNAISRSSLATLTCREGTSHVLSERSPASCVQLAVDYVTTTTRHTQYSIARATPRLAHSPRRVSLLLRLAHRLFTRIIQESLSL